LLGKLLQFQDGISKNTSNSTQLFHIPQSCLSTCHSADLTSAQTIHSPYSTDL